jgi:hypothetical protein
MAKATRQRGFEYFGVADHSKSAHFAETLVQAVRFPMLLRDLLDRETAGI